MNQGLGGLVHRHVHGRVVVGGADDEVNFGDETLGVALIVMDQGAPGGLHATNAPGGPGGNGHPDIFAGDFRVFQELNRGFRALQELNQAGVMVEQGEVGRPAERGPELLEFLLGQRGGHLVGHVDAGQGVGAVHPHRVVQGHV